MILIRICLVTILALPGGTAEGVSGSRQPETSTLADTTGISKPFPTQAESSAAATPVNSDTSRVNLVPEGFVLLKAEKTSRLSNLCNKDTLCQLIFMKVNRSDRSTVRAGKTVLLPVDIDKALQYSPLPDKLSDARGEREIRVFLDRQYFGAYENGKLVFWGPVSSGSKSHPTPTGKFTVNFKQRYKRSIRYDNAPMPYSINFYYGFFIHQQSLPGYPASHGCIRLLMDDAKKLFNWVQNGDPVTVTNLGGK